MNHAKYVLGIDFGTFSGQAILTRVSDGAVVASDVHYYSSGVITEKLPNGHGNSKLPPRFALQDPRDYLDVLKNTIPAVLQQSGVGPQEIIAIGTDFTSCTMLPVEADGTPLCFMPKWRSNPHAWAKLWKHHSPQPQADRINEIGRKRGEEFLKRYGGRYSSEWFFAKLLETVEKAPEVYDAADEFIEAGDWIVWQLVGHQRRGNCAAGYKAMWIKDRGGYPHYDFFKALHPKLEHVLDEKLGRLNIYPLATSAGGLSHKAAALTGLKEGTPVAVGTINAHAAVPGCGVTEPGRLCMVLGPSICHMLLARERREVEGICGVVEDGILPGLWAYEAGQSAAGDLLTWFCENAVPVAVHAEAERRGLSVPQWLEQQALTLRPGQSGLLALGWWNGNRSVLMDADLSGLLVGATLGTRPHEVFRALVEAVAFGTRKIVDAFTKAGLEINDLVAGGSLLEKSASLLQVFSDVTGRTIRVADSTNTAALGAAMHAAVAAGRTAGGYASLQEAARHMARAQGDVYRPHKAAHETYNQLYAEYDRLHDYFGRGVNPVMKVLKRLRDSAA